MPNFVCGNADNINRYAGMYIFETCGLGMCAN